MDPNVPYMPSVTNLHRILDKIQNAGVPDVFNLDFLRDLGFTSSNDRAVLKTIAKTASGAITIAQPMMRMQASKT